MKLLDLKKILEVNNYVDIKSTNVEFFQVSELSPGFIDMIVFIVSPGTDKKFRSPTFFVKLDKNNDIECVFETRRLKLIRNPRFMVFGGNVKFCGEKRMSAVENCKNLEHMISIGDPLHMIHLKPRKPPVKYCDEYVTGSA